MYSRYTAALLLALAARPLAAQAPLTVAEALRRADAAAYGNRAAAGARLERDGQALAPLRGVLPSLRVEGGWMRTDDPIGAFGITLRQRSVSLASFNPATLNDPNPVSDVAGGLVAEVPLLNPDALLGRRAAVRAAGAAAAMERWTRETTRLDVVRAYYGAVLAAEKAAALDTAAQSAQRHVQQAEAMAAQGIVTRSDVLLARVRAAEVQADLAAARADVAIARRALAVTLGAPSDTLVTLPAVLPAADRIRRVAADSALAGGTRADVEAVRLGSAAADADRSRARALLLPRLNAFGRYDWHDPSAPFAGQPMWTVGVMASWSPFSGAMELGESRQAAGRAAAARAMREGAEARAALEDRRSASDLDVALTRLAIADTAVAQGAEAHRLVSRRYDGGLATVVELLDAAALDTATRLRFSAAHYDAIVALAARRLALGVSLAGLDQLDHE